MDGNPDTKQYYLYGNNFSESANTIITQLHTFLSAVSTKKELWITFDNHSTQKNYTVLAYFQWLLSFSGFLRDQRTIHLIFLVAGHTHNRLDRANSVVSRKYFSSHSITTPEEFATKINEIRHYGAQIQKPMWDFKEFLAPHICSRARTRFEINRMHHVEITPQGIRTKLFDESEWRVDPRTEKPFQLLISNPEGMPSRLQSSGFSKERELQKVFGVDVWNATKRQLAHHSIIGPNTYLFVQLPRGHRQALKNQ